MMWDRNRWGLWDFGQTAGSEANTVSKSQGSCPLVDSSREFLVLSIISKIEHLLHCLMLVQFEFLCVLKLIILIVTYSIGSGPDN